MELTNYHSDFDNCNFRWDAEIHYSQGKDRASLFKPEIIETLIDKVYLKEIKKYIKCKKRSCVTYNRLQSLYCMTTKQREQVKQEGPYELLSDIRKFLDLLLDESQKSVSININDDPYCLPQAILIGYYILNSLVIEMGGKCDGCCN